MRNYLGGGFKHFFLTPKIGEDFQFDQYFSDGLKPATSYDLGSFFTINECHEI